MKTGWYGVVYPGSVEGIYSESSLNQPKRFSLLSTAFELTMSLQAHGDLHCDEPSRYKHRSYRIRGRGDSLESAEGRDGKDFRDDSSTRSTGRRHIPRYGRESDCSVRSMLTPSQTLWTERAPSITCICWRPRRSDLRCRSLGWLYDILGLFGRRQTPHGPHHNARRCQRYRRR